MSHATNNRNKMVARMSPKKPGSIKKALAWSKRHCPKPECQAELDGGKVVECHEKQCKHRK